MGPKATESRVGSWRLSLISIDGFLFAKRSERSERQVKAGHDGSLLGCVLSESQTDATLVVDLTWISYNLRLGGPVDLLLPVITHRLYSTNMDLLQILRLRYHCPCIYSHTPLHLPTSHRFQFRTNNPRTLARPGSKGVKLLRA